MVLRHETVTVNNGTGRLAIRRNKTATGFFVDHTLYSMHWSEGQSEDRREFFIPGGDMPVLDATCQPLVEHLPSSGQSLTEYFMPILDQLASGQYELTLETGTEVWRIAEAAWRFPEGDVGWYCPQNTPNGIHILSTQIEDANSWARARMWSFAIQEGQRPLVILAAVPGEWFTFLLDGYYKLDAYIQLRIPPHCLRIRYSEDRLEDQENWLASIHPPKLWKDNPE